MSLGIRGDGASGAPYVVASGTDTYTASYGSYAGYVLGDSFEVLFTNANTGASTININSLGAKALKKNGTVALDAGDIQAGSVKLLTYDGTNFQITAVGTVNTTGTPVAGQVGVFSDVDSITGFNFYSQDFRLTLASGTPVPVTDITGATIIYATPYTGKNISLYNGTSWVLLSSAEFSVALGTITDDQGYDVFCYSNSGVPTLELLAWTNNTTRATAIAYQDGVAVKTGDATRRYMGSFLTTSTTTTEDSLVKRYLDNHYHKVPRQMFVASSAATYSYTTATFRQTNADATNQLNFFVGLSQDIFVGEAGQNTSNTTATILRILGIGFDSITATWSQPVGRDGQAPGTGSAKHVASYIGMPVVGKHYIASLEWSTATGTCSWLIGSHYISAIKMG